MSRTLYECELSCLCVVEVCVYVSRVVTNMLLNKWVDLLKKGGENDGRYGIAAKVRIKGYSRRM